MKFNELERQCEIFLFGISGARGEHEQEIVRRAAQFAVNRIADAVPNAVADERARLLNTPEIADFARGIILEAQHARERWEDGKKRDFDWHAVATCLAAKALLNPPQNDGTAGEDARLHRIIALGALCANWHAAVAARARLMKENASQ